MILFLHDIEKPIKYSKLSGQYGSTSDEIRSNLIEKFGINLNQDQVDALKYIHGEGDDYTSKRRVMSPLSAFCHCCDMISARILFNR